VFPDPAVVIVNCSLQQKRNCALRDVSSGFSRCQRFFLRDSTSARAVVLIHPFDRLQVNVRISRFVGLDGQCSESA
jgi:hypothetical protein